MIDEFEFPDYLGKYISNSMHDEMMFVTSQIIVPDGVGGKCCRLEGVTVTYKERNNRCSVSIDSGDYISYYMYKDGSCEMKEVSEEEFFKFLKTSIEKCGLRSED